LEIFIVRHTTPDVNKGVCYGQTDLKLSDSYPRELAAIKPLLPRDINHVYSSPLYRCASLAMDCYPSLDIVMSDDLKELNFGDWEMKQWNDLSPQEINPWMNDFVYKCPPKGESMIDLKERVINWFFKLQMSKIQKTVIFTHAGVIRVLLSHIHSTPLRQSFEKYPIQYGEVIRLDVE